MWIWYDMVMSSILEDNGLKGWQFNRKKFKKGEYLGDGDSYTCLWKSHRFHVSSVLHAVEF